MLLFLVTNSRGKDRYGNRCIFYGVWTTKRGPFGERLIIVVVGLVLRVFRVAGLIMLWSVGLRNALLLTHFMHKSGISLQESKGIAVSLEGWMDQFGSCLGRTVMVGLHLSMNTLELCLFLEVDFLEKNCMLLNYLLDGEHKTFFEVIIVFIIQLSLITVSLSILFFMLKSFFIKYAVKRVCIFLIERSLVELFNLIQKII
jgi:hypothetical protein